MAVAEGDSLSDLVQIENEGQRAGYCSVIPPSEKTPHFRPATRVCHIAHDPGSFPTRAQNAADSCSECDWDGYCQVVHGAEQIDNENIFPGQILSARQPRPIDADHKLGTAQRNKMRTDVRPLSCLCELLCGP